MERRFGALHVTACWNWPVVTLSWLRVVFRPEDDPRAWFVRARIGPWKLQAWKDQ